CLCSSLSSLTFLFLSFTRPLAPSSTLFPYTTLFRSPRLVPYVKELWKRRSFIQVLASSKAEAENQNTYLGQIWALVSPTINASVYVLIFGFLLTVGRAGIENTIAFIVVGVFMFRFFERSVMAGSHSLNKNMNLVRSVNFPRAVLPAAGVLAELM